MLRLIPNLINALLLGGAVTNEATDGIVTEITKIDSLEMLVSIAGVAAIQFVVTWVKRRFGGNDTPPKE